MTQTAETALEALHAFFLHHAGYGPRIRARTALADGAVARIKAAREGYRKGCGGGMCHLVTEFVEARWGWPRVAVAYLDMEGRVITGGHYANVLPGGAILDPTSDQFGEGHDIRVVLPTDPEYRRYRPEWNEDYNPGTNPWCARIALALGVTYEGGEDDDLADANDAGLGRGWWLDDLEAYARFWREALAHAEGTEGNPVIEYAKRRLEALEDLGAAYPGPGR